MQYTMQRTIGNMQFELNTHTEMIYILFNSFHLGYEEDE